MTSETYLGVNAAELGDTRVSGTTVTGTVRKATVPEWGGGAKTGYFIYLHFDGAVKLYTENHPEGKDADETGDWLILLGEDEPTLTWFEIEDENGKRIRYNVDVTAEPGVTTNTIDAKKWGYCAKVADLDALIEPGESAKIDHDTQIFYIKLGSAIGADYAKYAAILTIAGTEYACRVFNDAESTGSLIGPGPNRTNAHKSDLDFACKGGKWEAVAEGVDVAGQPVTFEVKKYAADVSAEALAGEGEVVFGPQEIDCRQTQAFNATAKVKASAKRKVAAKPKAAKSTKTTKTKKG